MQEQNNDSFKITFRKVKIGGCLIALLFMMYSNGLFNYEDKQYIDYDLLNEIFGLKNIIVTLKEIWFVFVIMGLFILARSYNNYLDE